MIKSKKTLSNDYQVLKFHNLDQVIVHGHQAHHQHQWCCYEMLLFGAGEKEVEIGKKREEEGLKQWQEKYLIKFYFLFVKLQENR